MSEGLGLRYWNKRMTRRRLLGTAAVGGGSLAALALVGCDGGGGGNGGNGGNGGIAAGRTPTDGTQDGPGKPGGILRSRQAVTLPNMNPFGPSILSLAQGLTLGFTVFDHMWYVPTDTGDIELFLATSVEQPDPLTVIATLGDATFHDRPPVNGRKVLASDVVASFKKFQAQIPIGFSWLQHVMDDITATGDNIVTIKQNRPWAWVFTSSNAGSPWSSSILPAEVIEDDGFMQSNAIGSGHWMLDSHENGANLKLRKFPNFRVPGQPLLDGIDFITIDDDTLALAAFRAGELDVGGFPTHNEAEDAAAEFGDRMVISNDLNRDYDCLMMSYREPFLDERVRHAINLLIDRDEIILLMDDGDGVKSGPLPPAHTRYALSEDELEEEGYFTHDIEEARSLLDAASYDYDQEIVLRHSNRTSDSKLAQILQNQLGQGGVKIKLEQEDLVKWFSQTLGTGDFHMTAFRHLAYEDPDLPLRFFLGSAPDRKNFMNYQDDEVDEAVLAAATELEEEARVEKVKEAQRTIIRRWAPMINIYSQISYSGRYSYVKGTITGRGSYGLFNRTTWLDKS